MKDLPRALGTFLVLCSLVTGTACVAQAQDLPLDRRAIFRTAIAHRNSQIQMGGGGASPQAKPGGGSSIFTGNPYGVGSTVAATTTVPAAEPHIWADPSNASVLLGAISDFSQRGGFNTTKWTFSTDGGASWSEGFVPFDEFGVLRTDDGYAWDANSDPVVAVDKQGNAYLATLYFDALGLSNGVYVGLGSSTASGVSFNTYLPVWTNPELDTIFFEDKPWLTVDASDNAATTGNVYACWSRFVRAGPFADFVSDFIVFTRSANHGLSWTPPMRISPAAQDGAVQGCQVAVGPDGAVYLTYELFFVGGNRQHLLAKSTDGGQTFSAPVAITPLFNELAFNSSYRKNSFTSLAVNPLTGYVYVLYSDYSGKSGADVKFIRSTAPGGTAFTAPLRINDATKGQQFFAAITVDASGRIHAMWYDTRNAGNNNSRYDVYATYSTDNGATWGRNARVTAATIDAGGATFIGDYNGVAAAAGAAHPVWTNGGFNNGSMQTARLSLP
jgi:hypothetical protein